LYALDWAAFLAAEAKVKDKFGGNVVDLRSKYSPQDLMAMFYPQVAGPTMFKFPEERSSGMRVAPRKRTLPTPTKFDSEGQRCLIVGKDGNSTDLTVGYYAGLVSFTLNKVGIESVELGIHSLGRSLFRQGRLGLP